MSEIRTHSSDVFDLLEPLSERLLESGGPDIRTGFARATGGVDIPFVIEALVRNMQHSSDIPVSVQNITPECRENRTPLGALEEAISRVSQAYAAYHDAPANANVTWRISLVRVEPLAKLGGDQ